MSVVSISEAGDIALEELHRAERERREVERAAGFVPPVSGKCRRCRRCGRPKPTKP